MQTDLLTDLLCHLSSCLHVPTGLLALDGLLTWQPDVAAGGTDPPPGERVSVANEATNLPAASPAQLPPNLLPVWCFSPHMQLYSLPFRVAMP